MINIPDVTFSYRIQSESESDEYNWKKITTEDLFKGKKIVLFSLPGAFTPTCSNKQLPEYEEQYQSFIDLGIDDVYCISVNDSFVMNAWFKDQGIQNVKSIPDGNGEFTFNMGMSVSKANYGLGHRSWRYTAIINDGTIEILFVEDGKVGNSIEDPYSVTDPKTVLGYLKSKKEEEEVVINYD